MSRPDKYNPYVSQKPVDTNLNSRATKRRKWKSFWREKCLGNQNLWKFDRQTRREMWRLQWIYFRDGVK